MESRSIRFDSNMRSPIEPYLCTETQLTKSLKVKVIIYYGYYYQEASLLKDLQQLIKNALTRWSAHKYSCGGRSNSMYDTIREDRH